MSNAADLPIWLINLEGNPERYQSAVTELNKAGLQAERFSAIYGKDLSADEIAASYDVAANQTHFRRPLSLGEIGCYLSHRALWQRMVDEDIEAAIILEDDIVVESAFSLVLEKLTTIKNWDMIKLADDRGGEGEDMLDIGQGYRLVNFNKVPNCTTGYAISLTGAKKLLQRNKIFRPIDIDLQFHPELELRLFSILPYRLWAASNFESEIDKMGGGTRKRDTTFIRNLRYRWQLWRIRKTCKSGNIDNIALEK